MQIHKLQLHDHCTLCKDTEIVIHYIQALQYFKREKFRDCCKQLTNVQFSRDIILHPEDVLNFF